MVFPTNLYGPRDNFDPSTSHVIPALILKVHKAKISNSKSVVVWGDGSPTRDFLYVEDAATGIVRAAERYEGQQPINLGSEQEISIKELVYKIVDLMGYDGDTSKPNGQPRRCVSTQRARELIGFRPAVNIHDGLMRTISWFENEVAHRVPQY